MLIAYILYEISINIRFCRIILAGTSNLMLRPNAFEADETSSRNTNRPLPTSQQE